MQQPHIVSEQNKIDAAWLTAVLRQAGVDGTVSDFNATTIGTGQVGENVRFELIGDEVPATVVGKFPSADPVSKQTGIDLQNYVREVFFYETLQDTVDITTPRVYFADVDPETHDFVIIMEDLAPGEPGDQLAGCNIDEAALALEELAKLQGPRWGDESLTEYPLLASAGGDPTTMQQFYKSLEPGFLERYDTWLDGGQQAIVSRLGTVWHPYQDIYTGPPGLIHVDYRLDNMMFGGPYKLAVVDWQSIALGCPVADASYFLGTSLPPDIRAKEERHLFRHYLDVLKSYKVDLDDETGFSLYRNFAPGGLIMAVIASMIVGQTERGDAMFMAMAQRSARMCEDLGSL
ncbi:MAG: phosphotransferase [Gammaproteobacteria bacterium]|nr:phosphotransferase [Gammaproteobacteria bacterium]